MAELFFICPKTHQQGPTGIETDVQSLSAFWRATLKVNCPRCGETHEISVCETYVDWAIRDAIDRPRQVATGPRMGARRSFGEVAKRKP